MCTKHAEQLHLCMHTFICTHPYAYCNAMCIIMYVCTYAHMPCMDILIKNAYNYVRMYICIYVRVNACIKVADTLLIMSKISKTIICKISGNLSV